MLVPPISVLENRIFQSDRVGKGTKGQRGHFRCNDIGFSALDILKDATQEREKEIDGV